MTIYEIISTIIFYILIGIWTYKKVYKATQYDDMFSAWLWAIIWPITLIIAIIRQTVIEDWK